VQWMSSVGFSNFFPPCCTAPLKFKFTFHKVPRRPWLWPFECTSVIPWLAAVQTLRAIGYPHGPLFSWSFFDRQIYSSGYIGPLWNPYFTQSSRECLAKWFLSTFSHKMVVALSTGWS
jgi:hypothetical protein